MHLTEHSRLSNP